MSFDFDRDTFAFANELLWEYQVDPTTRKTYFQRRIPAPSYSHRCFGVVRSARQFWYHSTFEPELPPDCTQGLPMPGPRGAGPLATDSIGDS